MKLWSMISWSSQCASLPNPQAFQASIRGLLTTRIDASTNSYTEMAAEYWVNCILNTSEKKLLNDNKFILQTNVKSTAKIYKFRIAQFINA